LTNYKIYGIIYSRESFKTNEILNRRIQRYGTINIRHKIKVIAGITEGHRGIKNTSSLKFKSKA
jgi:hypothetical protein